MTKEIPALLDEERGYFFYVKIARGIAIFISLIRERTCNLQ